MSGGVLSLRENIVVNLIHPPPSLKGAFRFLCARTALAVFLLFTVVFCYLSSWHALPPTQRRREALMLALVKWLYLMALIIWLGEVIFFSFVGAPSLFTTFPTPEAGKAVGAIFPTYYRIGYVCGVVLLLGALVLAGSAMARGWWMMNALVAAVMLAVILYAGLVIQPRAAALRPQIHETTAPAPAVKEEFDRLHHLAVMLNGVVLVCGLAVSALTASAIRP